MADIERSTLKTTMKRYAVTVTIRWNYDRGNKDDLVEELPANVRLEIDTNHRSDGIFFIEDIDKIIRKTFGNFPNDGFALIRTEQLA